MSEMSPELRAMLEKEMPEHLLVALDRDPAARVSGTRPTARPRPWDPVPANMVDELKAAGYKQCNCCGQVLANGTAEQAASYGDFGYDRSMKDGRKSSCRECCGQQSRESTARTRGREFECSSANPAVLAVFPSFPADPERAAEWAAAHPEAAAGASGTTEGGSGSSQPRRRQRTTEAANEPDLSPLVEASETGVIQV